MTTPSDERAEVFCPTCGQPLALSRLLQIRILRHLSLRDVGPEVGLSISQLSRLERKESEPLLATARQLARYYEVDLDWLFPDEQ